MKINVQRVKFALALLSFTVVTVVFKRFSLTNNHKSVSPPPIATCFIKDTENVSIQDTQELSSSSIHFIQSNLTVQKPYSSSISNLPFATIDIKNAQALRRVTGRILQHFTENSSESALIQKSGNQFVSMVAARYHLQRNCPIRNPLLSTIAEPVQATARPAVTSSSRAVMPPSKMDMVQSIEDNTIDACIFQTKNTNQIFMIVFMVGVFLLNLKFLKLKIKLSLVKLEIMLFRPVTEFKEKGMFRGNTHSKKLFL